MSAYSKEFGLAVKALRAELGLTREAAFQATEGAVSLSYWGKMEAGAIPSREKVDAIRRTFGDAAREVVAASGYSFPEPASSLGNKDMTAALPVPAGAMLIGDGDPLRLGPTPSAQDGAEIGDVGYDTYSLDADAKAAGADYVVRVKGHCLDPYIRDGDMVAVKFSQTARNDQIVVAQVMEDAFRGELGDSLTLKVYRTGSNRGFYRADGTQAHGGIDARIVGIVVRHYPAKVPSIS